MNMDALNVHGFSVNQANNNDTANSKGVKSNNTSTVQNGSENNTLGTRSDLLANSQGALAAQGLCLVKTRANENTAEKNVLSDTRNGKTQIITYSDGSRDIITYKDNNSTEVNTVKKYDKDKHLLESQDNVNKTKTTYTWENGKIKSSVTINEKNNTQTEATYENGKIASSKTYTYDANNADNKILKSEQTYENGKVKSKTTYIQSSSGLRVNTYTEYTRGNDGKVTKAEIYSDKEKTNKIHDWSYTYDSSTKKLATKEDSVTNNKDTYTYENSNGKLLYKETTYNNSDKKARYYYNEDGTCSRREYDGKVTLYTYENGIRKTATTYNQSDLNSDNTPKEGTTPVSTTTYTNGLKTRTVKGNMVTTYEYTPDASDTTATKFTIKKSTTENMNDGDNTGAMVKEYDDNGRLIKKTDISKQTETTYTYNTDGTKTATVKNNKNKTTTEISYNADGKKTKVEQKDTETGARKSVLYFKPDDSKHPIAKIKGNYVYVYTYENGTLKSTTKYNKDDWDEEKMAIKDGSQPVT